MKFNENKEIERKWPTTRNYDDERKSFSFSFHKSVLFKITND